LFLGAAVGCGVGIVVLVAHRMLLRSTSRFR
jgi:hypothetical protein